MCYFASQLIAKIAQFAAEEVRGGIGHFFVLLLFLLLGLFLFNLLYLHFNHVEGIENSVSVGSVLVDVVGSKGPPWFFDVVFDEVEDGEYESDSKQKSNEDGGGKNNDVSGIVES